MEDNKPRLYDKMPLEVVLNIWKLAFNSDGVHHFRLEVNTKQPLHRLIISPWETSGSPSFASSWRQRMKMSIVDHSARTAYTKWVDELAADGALWVAPLPVRRGQPQTPEFASRVKVNAKKDLVVFTFVKNYFNVVLLDWSRTREQFQGLRNIAFNWKQTSTGESWGATPFMCACRTSHGPTGSPCPWAIPRVVRLFPDVQHVYFIYRVNAQDLTFMAKRLAANQAKEDTATKSRGVKSKVPKMSAGQLIEASIAEFHKLAEKKGLQIWADCERSFIEVHRDDLGTIFNTEECNGVKKSLIKCEEVWDLQIALDLIRGKPSAPCPRFHFMVCRQNVVRKATSVKANVVEEPGEA
ncbi:hypothetical protein PFICI_03187 [Pestalotiopsis fici W106-1]|uniref:Uncharacterized protein n=1 Tax=Pestalotiopsis fici (strain W106-1 / CGMCC3.15140) TaxID=1229662 RepID=W3XI88_PESFW|nr:uncharacterized protein PFICI_03187 [Pestalotiopsis fici W106-1]ETS85162.1 hypothetical protein PFICI_03187 [Pestalotiopsis fici W106-1]